MRQTRRGTHTLQSLQNPLHSAGAAATAHRNVELVLVVRHGWSGRKKRIGDSTAGQRGEVERMKKAESGRMMEYAGVGTNTREREREYMIYLYIYML